MKQLNIEDFPNSTGWVVKHDPKDNLFYIVSEKNNKRKHGKFTDRKFAEAALHEYLSTLSSKAQEITDKGNAAKKRKAEEAAKKKAETVAARAEKEVQAVESYK